MTSGSQNRLVLRHPAFRRFVDPYFRMSRSDGEPVLAFQVDGREATLPLHRLARDLGIAADDDDARQLELVGPALNFVTGIRVGDLIPSEVLTGEASWAGEDVHRDLAVSRINLFILAWLAGYTVDRMDRTTTTSLLQGRSAAKEVSLGIARLAEHLGIDHGSLVVRIAGLATELAYIEALREWLLRGAMRMAEVLTRVTLGFTGDSSHMETLVQVRRLCATGIADIQEEFASVDRMLMDPTNALRDCDGSIATLRRKRDALYSRWRAWEPFQREWCSIELRPNARTQQLANETYQFLAPRYMTAIEWRVTARHAGRSTAGMRW